MMVWKTSSHQVDGGSNMWVELGSSCRNMSPFHPTRKICNFLAQAGASIAAPNHFAGELHSSLGCRICEESILPVGCKK